MKVSVICFGAMRAHLPAGAIGNQAEIEVPDRARVGDVADALGADRRLVFAVLVDGRQASIDDRVADGAVVTLMPPFAGGSFVPSGR